MLSLIKNTIPHCFHFASVLKVLRETLKPTLLVPAALQVFLTKHYKNRRLGDPEFVLDFEEIYVIDSKTKSITRAKVLVRNC